MTDQVANLKKVTVSTTYDASATSIVLTTGHGARLPDPSGDNYNLVWWNSTNYPDPSDDPNVEIIRVTAKSTDILTVIRNQEGSGDSTKNNSGATYKMILGPTAKTITDLQTEIDSDITTHAILTTTHGITGNIVGTSDTQNLLNKTIAITCYNATGSVITARSVCYISGDQSGVPQITKAQADAEANAKGMLVMVISEIADGTSGVCVVMGTISGFSGLTSGAIQYLSDDTAGAIEETATTTSTEIVRIVGYALSATVVYFHPDISYVEVA